MFPSKQFCISHTPVKPVTITHSSYTLFSLSLGASLQFLFQPHSPSAVDPASQQSSVRSSSGQAQNPKAHQVTTGSTPLNPGQILKEKELRENRGKRNLRNTCRWFPVLTRCGPLGSPWAAPAQTVCSCTGRKCVEASQHGSIPHAGTACPRLLLASSRQQRCRCPYATNISISPPCWGNSLVINSCNKSLCEVQG